MVYFAIKVKDFEAVTYFDDSKHTSEELQEFRNMYSGSKGYTIFSKSKIENSK
jgi:hypothetical protein